MEELIKVAGQYGALGLMLLASFYYINKKDKDHKEERNEINTRFEQQHEEAPAGAARRARNRSAHNPVSYSPNYQDDTTQLA